MACGFYMRNPLRPASNEFPNFAEDQPTLYHKAHPKENRALKGQGLRMNCVHTQAKGTRTPSTIEAASLPAPFAPGFVALRLTQLCYACAPAPCRTK